MKGRYTTNTPITIESLIRVAEELEKHKITVTASYLMEEDNIFVLDHEKMREENCFTDKRGKEIICNPKYEELIKNELHI